METEARNEHPDPPPTAPRPLTGSMVYNHFSHPCPYRVHMDLFGERSKRTPPGVAARWFMERGIRHEGRVFAELLKRHPGDCVVIGKDANLAPEQDLERRAAATLEAMSAGRRYVLHGVLCTELGEVVQVIAGGQSRTSDFRLRGETDVLERVETPSPAFGDWSYRVADVKSSQEARFAQKMQVAFYSWILERRQGRSPEAGIVITGKGEWIEFRLADLQPTLDLFIEEEIHDYREESPTFRHLEPACGGCHWIDHCRRRAEADDDLALIPGARRSQRRALLAAGIDSRKALRAADEKTLRALGRAAGGRLDGFRDLARAASAQAFGKPVLRQSPASVAAARGRHGPATPDLFAHRGMVLLVASLVDGATGEVVGLGTRKIRVDELRSTAGTSASDFESSFLLQGPDDRPGALLRRLWNDLAATNRLLARSGESVLPVLVSSRLPNRLRRQALTLETSPAAAAFIEGLLADAVVLRELIERCWFLHREARGMTALERCLAGTQATEPRDLLAEMRAAGVEPDEASSALEALTAICRDFDLPFDELTADEPGLRALLLREWIDGKAEGLAPLLRSELSRDLGAGLALVARVLRFRG